MKNLFILLALIFSQSVILGSEKIPFTGNDAPDQEKIDYYNDLKLNPPYEEPYNGSRDCVDTDNGATDPYGDGCACLLYTSPSPRD